MRRKYAVGWCPKGTGPQVWAQWAQRQTCDTSAAHTPKNLFNNFITMPFLGLSFGNPEWPPEMISALEQTELRAPIMCGKTFPGTTPASSVDSCRLLKASLTWADLSAWPVISKVQYREIDQTHYPYNHLTTWLHGHSYCLSKFSNEDIFPVNNHTHEFIIDVCLIIWSKSNSCWNHIHFPCEVNVIKWYSLDHNANLLVEESLLYHG